MTAIPDGLIRFNSIYTTAIRSTIEKFRTDQANLMSCEQSTGFPAEFHSDWPNLPPYSVTLIISFFPKTLSQSLSKDYSLFTYTLVNNYSVRPTSIINVVDLSHAPTLFRVTNGAHIRVPSPRLQLYPGRLPSGCRS